MFLDFVAAVLGDVCHEAAKFITGEVFDAATGLAKEEVVVAGEFGDEGLAAVGVVDALDGPEFFQFFQGAIDGDEAEAGAIRAGEVVHVGRAEGTVAGGDGFNDSPARGGETVAVGLEEGEPGLDAVSGGGWGFHA